MAIYINDQEAENLARELSAATGETITATVIIALRERRERLRLPALEERIARVLALCKRTAAIIGSKPVDFDELYDDDGLPK